MKKEIFITVCTKIACFLGIEIQEFITQLTTLLFDCFPKETEEVAIQEMDIGTQKKVLRDNITTLLKAEVIYVISKDGVCTKIMMDSGSSSSATFGFNFRKMLSENQVSTVIIPEGMSEIEELAFEFCKIRAIIMPTSITRIGSGAFVGTDIKGITIPKGVTDIKYSTCRFCNYLEDVSLPAGIKTIEELAFEGCKSLKNINIPESVTIIERGAFADCPNLPDDVKARILEIGGEAALLKP